MIVLSGTPFSTLIEFPSGSPDGNVAWTVYDSAGTALATGSVTPAPASTSAVLTIAGTHNLVSGAAVQDYRDLTYSYTVGGFAYNDSIRYNLEIRLPFGVSANGVRAKLGVNREELHDDEIGLSKAFLIFQGTVTEPLLSAVPTTGLAGLHVRDAVEALAALELVSTMSVRVAKSEDSGTNKFSRQPIDWEVVAAGLLTYVNDGYLAVVPTYDVTSAFTSLFILAPPLNDAYTGA